MKQFLPDAESITEYCGAFEALGYRFSVVPSPHLGGYGLRMEMGPDSTASPIFPLPAVEMQTEEAARRWMAELRDTRLSQFVNLLRAA